MKCWEREYLKGKRRAELGEILLLAVTVCYALFDMAKTAVKTAVTRPFQ